MTEYRPPAGRPPSRPPEWRQARNVGWLTPDQSGWSGPEQRRDEVRQLMAEKNEPVPVFAPRLDSPQLAKLKQELEDALTKQTKQQPTPSYAQMWTPAARDNWHAAFMSTINKRRSKARELCKKLNATETDATWMVSKDVAKMFDMTTVGVRLRAKSKGWQMQSYSRSRLLMVRVPHAAMPKEFPHKPITRPAPIIPKVPGIVPHGSVRLIFPPERPSLWRRFLQWCIR